MKEVTWLSQSPLVIALSKELDSANADEFYGAVRAYYNASPSDITFVCDELVFIDSTALGTFVKILKMVKTDGHALKITGLSERIKKLFVICALDRIMEIA